MSVDGKLINKLADKSLYAEAVTRIQKKLHAQDGIFRSGQEGVLFHQFALDKEHLSKQLARMVGKGEYAYSPTKKITVRKKDKTREVVLFNYTDRIVQSALFAAIVPDLKRYITPNLYSFIRGRSAHLAVEHACLYIRRMAKKRKYNDLYLLHTDITACTDSIPTGPDAPLWPKLQAFLDFIAGGKPLPKSISDLFYTALRPKVDLGENKFGYLDLGIPMGSPITNLGLILYLNDLDNIMRRHDGAFYARYGDDFLFLHPDPEIVKNADRFILDHLSELGLSCKEEKKQYLYLNVPGRASEDPFFKGCASFTFLGRVISAKGQYAATSIQYRSFLREIREIAAAMARQLSFKPDEEKGPHLCQALGMRMDSKHPQSIPSVSPFLNRTADKIQMKQADYLLALCVAEILTGVKGPRAFRLVPYRRLREWGLPSLFELRDKHYYAQIKGKLPAKPSGSPPAIP